MKLELAVFVILLTTISTFSGEIEGSLYLTNSFSFSDRNMNSGCSCKFVPDDRVTVNNGKRLTGNGLALRIPRLEKSSIIGFAVVSISVVVQLEWIPDISKEKSFLFLSKGRNLWKSLELPSSNLGCSCCHQNVTMTDNYIVIHPWKHWDYKNDNIFNLYIETPSNKSVAFVSKVVFTASLTYVKLEGGILEDGIVPSVKGLSFVVTNITNIRNRFIYTCLVLRAGPLTHFILLALKVDDNSILCEDENVILSPGTYRAYIDTNVEPEIPFKSRRTDLNIHVGNIVSYAPFRFSSIFPTSGTYSGGDRIELRTRSEIPYIGYILAKFGTRITDMVVWMNPYILRLAVPSLPTPYRTGEDVRVVVRVSLDHGKTWNKHGIVYTYKENSTVPSSYSPSSIFSPNFINPPAPMPSVPPPGTMPIGKPTAPTPDSNSNLTKTNNPPPKSEVDPKGKTLINWLRDNLMVVVVAGISVVIILFMGIVLFKVYKNMNTMESKLSMETISTTETDSLLLNFEDNSVVPFEELRIGKRIGRGSGSDVYLTVWRGSEVAVKKLPEVYRSSDRDMFLKEAKMILGIRHPNVICCMAVSIDEPDYCLVLEYCVNGSLHDIIHDDGVVLEDDHIRRMSLDCCRGMAYLHDSKIIHRDLKSKNLLVDEYWRVKVSDFGLSKILDSSSVRMMTRGSPAWTAPEVLRKKKYSFFADVYSFGIVLWEVCTRKIPYANIPSSQVVMGVVEGNLTLAISDQEMDPYFQEVYLDCIMESPELRPSFKKLIEIFIAMEDYIPPADEFPTITPLEAHKGIDLEKNGLGF